MEDLLQKPDVIQQNPVEAPPEYSTGEPPDFSVLRLNHQHLHSPCANCGFSSSGNANSLKRPSPVVNSQQPKPKKLFLDEPTAATNTHDDYPFLRRSVSDPYHPPPAQSPPDSAPASGSGISSNALLFSPSPAAVLPDSSATPCSAAKGSAASSSDCPALPPRPPPTKLRRCISDPSPAKSLSRSSSSNDMDKTDHSKKMRKIWHCWKEMNMWMEEVLQVEQSENQTESLVEQEEVEQEEPEQEHEIGGVATTPTHTDEANDNNVTTKNLESELEESLSVERDGKCLNIQFKCHCGKGYHFLLSDGSCFYKLM